MNIGSLLDGLLGVFNAIGLLIIALAGLFFFYNVFKYFIQDSAAPDKREEAGRFALWSIVAFVFIVSIWGIVNLLTGAFFPNSSSVPCPDAFDPNFQTGSNIGDCMPGSQVAPPLPTNGSTGPF